MAIQIKYLLDSISGAQKSRGTRILLHILFWAIMLKWLLFQSNWMFGNKNVSASLFITFFRYIFLITFFYTLTAVPRLKISNLWISVTWTCCLVVFMLGYCLMMYFICKWVYYHFGDLSNVFKNIYESLNANGPWTFLHSPLVFYFHFEQLGLALLPPAIVKILRLTFQSRLKSANLEKNNLELELNFLRSQINPHFLFNTLNSLYSLIEEKDAVAASIVSSLSNMMRYALYESNVAEVSVSRELDFIKGYIDIQNVRYSNRLSFEIDFSEEVNNHKVPPLILVTFLENAVKHGLDKMIQKCIIEIRAYVEKEKFCFFISNTKPNKPAPARNEGIGIKNTERRLDILYPQRHELTINQTATQFTVLLKIW